jgi:hypothetical protein
MALATTYATVSATVIRNNMTPLTRLLRHNRFRMGEGKLLRKGRKKLLKDTMETRDGNLFPLETKIER